LSPSRSTLTTERAARAGGAGQPQTCFADADPHFEIQLNSPTEIIAAPDVVALDLIATSGDDAIRALHQRLRAATPDVKDAAQFLQDLLERAAVASVCISDEVALPHARTAAVKRIVLAVARTATPVAFDPEHPGVRLVFLIGTPKAAVAEYLQTVAALSRLLKSLGTKGALLAAANEIDFRAILARGLKR
jgi:mannitol/fructose-specific phosphotransferase system IIA component (Ntr-type)